MIYLNKAVLSLQPSAEFTSNDSGIVKWLSPAIPQPTEAEIQAEVTQLQAEYDSQEYARNRKAEYDKLNQYELMFDDQQNGTTTWVDSINAIKAKYPKENT